LLIETLFWIAGITATLSLFYYPAAATAAVQVLKKAHPRVYP
jgi:hypothetical protein